MCDQLNDFRQQFWVSKLITIHNRCSENLLKKLNGVTKKHFQCFYVTIMITQSSTYPFSS